MRRRTRNGSVLTTMSIARPKLKFHTVPVPKAWLTISRRQPPCARPSGSGDCVDRGVGEIARHDRHGYRLDTRREHRDQRTWAFLCRARCQNEDRDVLVGLDELEQRFGRAALREYELADDAGEFIDVLGGGVDLPFGFLARLRPHDRLDPAPLLEIGSLCDAEERDATAGVLGPTRGEAHRHPAFFGLVDDDEELARSLADGLAHKPECCHHRGRSGKAPIAALRTPDIDDPRLAVETTVVFRRFALEPDAAHDGFRALIDSRGVTQHLGETTAVKTIFQSGASGFGRVALAPLRTVEPPHDLDAGLHGVTVKNRHDPTIAKKHVIGFADDGHTAKTQTVISIAIALKAGVALGARAHSVIVPHHLGVGTHACKIVAVVFAPRTKNKPRGPKDHSRIAFSR